MTSVTLSRWCPPCSKYSWTRGPGDYFGTRQSGVPLFRIADMLRDEPLREKAKKEAIRFMGPDKPDEIDKTDAELRKRLLRHVVDLWGERFGLAAAG